MEIIVANSGGFCFGVNRSIKLAEELLDENDNIYTYGPLIHNEIVTKDLEERGGRILTSLESQIDKTVPVLIRSHGISRKEENDIKNRIEFLYDATCPFVKKIHSIVENASKEGFSIIIIGDKNHPEVQGIFGWSTSNTIIISNEEDLQLVKTLPQNPIKIVVQTTFNKEKFINIVEKIRKIRYDIEVSETICDATNTRQKEALELSQKCDVMLVIGDKKSSNTCKLFDICHTYCQNSHHIQSYKDLEREWFVGAKVVGITAGASTPKKIIKEVQNYVRINF